MDLLPVMNLMMILIPFLLMGAAFFKIGVIPTSVANRAPAPEPGAPEEPNMRKVSVSLIIRENQLELSITHPTIPPETLSSYGGTFPGDPENWNLDQLQAAFQRILGQYPESDVLVIFPYDELGYQDLVRLVDASREFDTGELNEAGETVYSDLFPGVVFSKLHEPDPEELEAAAAAQSAEGG